MSNATVLKLLGRLLPRTGLLLNKNYNKGTVKGGTLHFELYFSLFSKMGFLMPTYIRAASATNCRFKGMHSCRHESPCTQLCGLNVLHTNATFRRYKGFNGCFFPSVKSD